MSEPPIDFDRLDKVDLSLVLAPTSPERLAAAKMYVYSRTFNMLVITNNLAVVNDIMDRNLLPLHICDQISQQCPAVKITWYDCNHRHAVLPEGWQWHAEDSILSLKDENGATQYSWYYGLARYSS